MEYLVQNFSAVKSRKEMMDGREYLVAPMTMIVPGVLNGSKGALYYPADEVGKDPTPWNGMPITYHHPVRNGKNVSARDPEVLEKQGIGVVLRSTANGKLRSEAWVDVQKANKLDPRIIQNMTKGVPLEISTGLFTDNTPAPHGSNHNGKPYQWVARNYRPDHLAILPDQRGACSVDDGCGIGVNAEPTDNDWKEWNDRRRKGDGATAAHVSPEVKSRAAKRDAGNGLKRTGPMGLARDSRGKAVMPKSQQKNTSALHDQAKSLAAGHSSSKGALKQSAAALVKSHMDRHADALKHADLKTANKFKDRAIKAATGYSKTRIAQHEKVAKAFAKAGNTKAAEHYQARADFHKAHVAKLAGKKPVANMMPVGEREFVMNQLAVNDFSPEAREARAKEQETGQKPNPIVTAVVSAKREREAAASAEVNKKIQAIKERKGTASSLSHDAHAASDRADKKEGSSDFKEHSAAHEQAARAHESAARKNGNSDEGKLHASLAKEHADAAKKISASGTAHAASDKADAMEGSKNTAKHGELHAAAAEAHKTAAATYGDTDVGKKHAALAKTHKQISQQLANNGEQRMSKRRVDNAMELGDREKAAHRLSRHAHEMSKTSEDYEGPIQHHSERAVSASRGRDHEAAGDSHLKASQAHLDASEDCVENSNPEGHNQWTGKATLTVKGDTFKAASKMKDEGFKWNPSEKHWHKDLNKVVHKDHGEGFADDAGNFKGTLQSIHHMVKTYAKSERFHIGVEHHPTTNQSSLVDNDGEQGDERGTHVTAAKAHQTAAASHYDVARVKAKPPVDEEEVETEPDEDDVIENSFGNYLTSDKECKMKSETANSHSELAEKTGRESDHGKAARFHQDASAAYMSHEDGPDTEKAAKHSKKAGEHAKKVGPGFLSVNQEGENMAKLTANQRSQIIGNLTSDKGCGCYTANDTDYLSGLSDERLNELKASADEHLATNGEGGKEVKQMTDQEWMDSAPPGIQAIVANGAAIMEEQKDSIIAKLVANIADAAKKTAVTTMLKAKTLPQVKEYAEVAQLAAPPVVQNRQQLVYGPLGNVPMVTDNQKDKDTDVEEMTPSRLNWKELANSNGKPLFQVNNN